MTCSHQFIIPPPNGATSTGICRLCGEKRDMFNSLEESKHTWRKTAKDQADAAKCIKGTLRKEKSM